MSDHQVDGFEDSDEIVQAEDLLECLRGNSIAMFLATIRFLEARDIPAGEWIDALGAMYLHGWDLDQEWTPETFLEGVLFNLEAFGGEAVQAEFGDDNASAVIAHFPDPERVEYLGLDDVDGDVIYDVIEPIAAACGLDWTWRREGDRVAVETSIRRDAS
jgi:hypothetical protein